MPDGLWKTDFQVKLVELVADPKIILEIVWVRNIINGLI